LEGDSRGGEGLARGVISLERHVMEELNIANADHELTSLKNGEIFE
jgi:hypothetical protein